MSFGESGIASSPFFDSKTGAPLEREKVVFVREDEIQELERGVHFEVDVNECLETGKGSIKVRWVDACKADAAYRSRLAAKDFLPKSKVGDIDGLFASMPALELVKLLFAAAAESCRKGKCQKIRCLF